ncbi:MULTISPECIES: hypothetical protein [unclassified Nocardia]|uniref:hypothetical protein n=1 Tax=unclassified Nocardia TaxID=2637762 RepID=UPI0026125B7E|nr:MULTISPECIES: hypothetical protein [unclassified Nocardia]MCU1641042.1 hypothetical protein [Nocardia sp.]WSJ18105.1 hypothetical protein OG326_12130 [Nocardia sp. NBC_01327]
MQKKTARGVFAVLAAGAALAAPAVANAEPLTLEPAPAATTTTTTNSSPVASLFDTNSATSMSSQVTSQTACMFQSISQQVDCFTGNR